MDPLFQAILDSSKEGLPSWVTQNLGANRVGGYSDVGPAPETNPVYEGRASEAYERGKEPGSSKRPFIKQFVDAFMGLGDPRAQAELPKARDVGEGFFNPPVGLGILAGKKALGAPLEKLKKALEAEARGVPSQEIWRKYGWERGADKQWRWEIPDDAARVSQRAQETLGGGASVETGVLGDVLEHPELFKAYPGLAQIPASVVKAARSGSYTPTMAEGGASIKAAAQAPESLLRTLTHEGQHGVQEVEGFAPGGSPEAMKQGEIASVRSRPMSAEDLKDPARTAYQRLAGETEARNAEARLVDSDLRKFAPGVTEDVPRLLQIVRAAQAAGEQLAVKEKGGMWHPEAVERLSEPLYSKLATGDLAQFSRAELRMGEGMNEPGYAQNKAAADWSDRAIRNYLNKYAGTKEDPLRDVEIPFGEGTKRWEDITDRIIKHKPVEAFDEITMRYGELPGGLDSVERRYRAQGLESVKPGEYVSDIPVKGQKALETHRDREALTSYLSHVGDYLREHVHPDKLAQYDLTRAVKETAALDAKMAKEMEKSAASTTKSLPVYKEYDGGFKWVELKKPERLTEEQAKMVKPGRENGPQGGEYIALDGAGKQIKNNYTGELAGGSTPEEAWLAGRLAEEGNQMGHCVGGYCHEVAEGNSKIYSLRDSKGKSHVTVEVEPPTLWKNQSPVDLHNKGVLTTEEFYRLQKDDKTNPGFSPEALGEAMKLPWREAEQELSRRWLANPENAKAVPSITQIKGKQNRAPVAEYLPYVQDFVRSGKWGEVEDIGNTGLMKNSKGEYVPMSEFQKGDL